MLPLAPAFKHPFQLNPTEYSHKHVFVWIWEHTQTEHQCCCPVQWALSTERPFVLVERKLKRSFSMTDPEGWAEITLCVSVSTQKAAMLILIGNYHWPWVKECLWVTKGGRKRRGTKENSLRSFHERDLKRSETEVKQFESHWSTYWLSDKMTDNQNYPHAHLCSWFWRIIVMLQVEQYQVAGY